MVGPLKDHLIHSSDFKQYSFTLQFSNGFSFRKGISKEDAINVLHTYFPNIVNVHELPLFFCQTENFNGAQ